MSDEQKSTSGGPDDDWVAIGGAKSPKRAATGNSLVDDVDPVQEEKVFTARIPTPPGKISVRVGAIALALMVLLYIFADLRDIETPWQRQFRAGWLLLVIPAMGILWGLIGLVKREAGDASRAMVGIVLSLASIGLAYGIVTEVRAKAQKNDPAAASRTALPPKDLSKWREEKLHREKTAN